MEGVLGWFRDLSENRDNGWREWVWAEYELEREEDYSNGHVRAFGGIS